MSNATRNAILRALIEGAITDLMVKTRVENVYIDDSTTLAAKLAEVIVSLNSKASAEALESGLDAKADADHMHVIEDVDGLAEVVAKVNDSPTNSEVDAKIAVAIGELLDGAPEAYDTLKELSAYISQHADVVETLNDAIGSKADAATVEAIQATVNSLGNLAFKSIVSEDDLDNNLKAKVNAASAGNHSHDNKALLDTYTQTNANLADAVAKKHSHANKELLDDITDQTVAEWNSKGKFYAQASQPANLKAHDLWAQLI